MAVQIRLVSMHTKFKNIYSCMHVIEFSLFDHAYILIIHIINTYNYACHVIIHNYNIHIPAILIQKELLFMHTLEDLN